VDVSQLLPHWARLRVATLTLTVDDEPAQPLAGALALRGGGARITPPGWRRGGALAVTLLLLPPGNVSGGGGGGGFRRVRLAAQLRVAHGRLSDLPHDVGRGADLPPARLALRWREREAAPGAARACTDRPAPWRGALSGLDCLLLSGGGGDAHGGDGDDASDAGDGDAVRYTAGMVLPLPSPDASMPFNVVCFVCTAMALLHSALIAVLTYRPGHAAARAREDAALKAAGHALPSLRDRLRARLRTRLKAKAE
jgi:hypothetical protein